MYLLRTLVLPAVGAAALAAGGCGGSGTAASAPARGDAASAQRTSSQPHPHEIVFLRRQYASEALAPEIHVYGDGSAYLLVPSGGVGIKREHCRLPASMLAKVRREVAAMPRRDLAGPPGRGDTFMVRANGHTATASQTHVPRSIRAIVRQLAGLIDDQGNACHVTQRFLTAS
jgi:hypothetical protein